MTDKNFWRWLLGILLLPAITVAVALVLLFGRVSAVERTLDAKPDSATVSALRDDIRDLRVDIRELRAELHAR